MAPLLLVAALVDVLAAAVIVETGLEAEVPPAPLVSLPDVPTLVVPTAPEAEPESRIVCPHALVSSVAAKEHAHCRPACITRLLRWHDASPGRKPHHSHSLVSNVAANVVAVVALKIGRTSQQYVDAMWAIHLQCLASRTLENHLPLRPPAHPIVGVPGHVPAVERYQGSAPLRHLRLDLTVLERAIDREALRPTLTPGEHFVRQR